MAVVCVSIKNLHEPKINGLNKIIENCDFGGVWEVS
jgi:hypothetical protein